MSETETMNTLDMENIPAPVAAVPENDNDIHYGNEDVDPNQLLKDILKINEDGHTDSQVLVTMERLHNVEEGMTLEELGDENREWIEDLEIEDCSLDIFSMDGEITCLNMAFDTPQSVYLRELNSFINRYRLAQEAFVQDENRNPNDMLMLSVMIMPNIPNYQAFLQLCFPIWWGRVVNDEGEANTMTIMFHSNNIDAYQIDISEEELTEIKADILREAESGTGGAIFEE